MNIFNKKQLRILAGSLLIFVSCFYLIHLLQPRAGSAPETPAPAVSATQSVPTVEVLTTTIKLNRGDVVNARHLGRMKIVGTVPPDAITDPQNAEFLVATTDIAAGQIIMRSALSETAGDAGLSVLVPVGKRAVALRVNDEISVGDFLRPGDRADLIAVFGGDGSTIGDINVHTASADQKKARIVLQNVEVLTVGSAVSASLSDKDRHSVQGNDAGLDTLKQIPNVKDVTLAVTPEQLLQLALVRSVGTYYLALRNYRDDAPTALVQATIDSVANGDAKLAANPQPISGVRTIEAFIGPKVQRIEIRP